MNQFIAKVLADKHGNPDEAIVAGIFGILVYIGMGIWSCAADPAHFQFIGFGAGFGTMAAGIGGWMFGKSRQPDQGVQP